MWLARDQFKSQTEGNGSKLNARREIGVALSAADKMKNAAESAKGKVKETAGEATDNKKLEAEGKFDQAKADAKKAGEDVKDAFTD